MKIALIGSHGTGKTEVSIALRQVRPNFIYFAEPVRHQIPAFGYATTKDIVDPYGIGSFELLNINNWGVTDPAVNTLLSPTATVVQDRSAVDNYGYYLTLRRSEQDYLLEDLVRRMATYYAGLVDQYFYFPTGVFPLVNDDLRIGDTDYQEKVGQNIQAALPILGVNSERVHILQAHDVEGRVAEILKVLETDK
jgi:hypothetical protein